MTRARLRGLLDRLETLAANRALCPGLPECSDRGRHSDELDAARKAVLALLASPAAVQPQAPAPRGQEEAEEQARAERRARERRQEREAEEAEEYERAMYESALRREAEREWERQMENE